MLAASAAGWIYPVVDPLNLIAVRCRAGAGAPLLTRSPGLPDQAYPHGDGLTGPEVRAVTLAALAPVPGQLLWDVGAGAGGISIEWMRSHPACRALAVERQQDRADSIERNARTLGVPGLRIVRGSAPGALAGLERPAAVFVSGGAAAAGVLAACWDALPPGGRLVADARTPQAEALLSGWQRRAGGELRRVAVSRAVPGGGQTPWWSPATPVAQWVVTRA
jgi:precorrin-6Y C5,15-methyltransferase (decarboxylating)